MNDLSDCYDKAIKELNDLKDKYISKFDEFNDRITLYAEIGDMEEYGYYRGMINGIRRVIASVNDIILKLVSEKEKIIDVDNKGEGGKNE